MSSYIFNEAGSIPGVPGTFANVRVDIADDGTMTQTPLALHPTLMPASDETPLETLQDEVTALTEEVAQEAVKPAKTKGV